MSDIYKELITLQRANNDVRGEVNEWLQRHLHSDCESLQALVMDCEGDFFDEPEDGWAEDCMEFNMQLEALKQQTYKQLLAFIKGVETERKESVEVSDPTQPIIDEPEPEPKPKKKAKPKPKSDDDVAKAIVTLLEKTKDGGLTEERVREIVLEEISKAIAKLYIGLDS